MLSSFAKRLRFPTVLFAVSLCGEYAVFSGIARPKFFLEELQELGVQPAAEVIFRDHQKYGDAQIKRLLQAKSASMADGFISTEKDVLNLGPRIAELGTVAVAQVTMELLDSDGAMEILVARL
jgi:tetraacyldisaccharide-1-P 4'-kinase